jgi:hypothetical protein
MAGVAGIIMIDIKQLEIALQKATERAIKIHDALDVPYITSRDGKVVEMSHGEIIREIEFQTQKLEL